MPSYTNYDVVATVYPVQMTDRCSDSVVNPCYKMTRILKSQDYKRHIIAVSDGILYEGNYDKRFKVYETPQHLIAIHLFTKDTVQGLLFMAKAVEYLTDVYNAYPSSQIEAHSDLEESMILDYRWDTCSGFSVCDVVDSPYVYTSPSMARYCRLVIVSLLIGLCVAMAGNIIVAEIGKESF